MKAVHYAALDEIASQFGPCKPVEDSDSGLQVGWAIEAEEETIQFNFTEDSIRIFKLSKTTPLSKYKSLELLRQCAKKAGLQHLVYYQVDKDSEARKALKPFDASFGASSDDGLDDIERHYKISDKKVQDSLGGGLVRIGSRRR